MNTALEVANYIVYLMSSSYEDLTNMKLNKMLYYAQGHSLKIMNQPLFDDPIEAWQHGPIVNSVYHQYKEYGDNPISDYDQSMLGTISDEIRDLLIGITRVYGRYSAAALRNMTHVPKGPWDSVYKENESHIIIPNALIKEYFDENVPDIKPVELRLEDDDFVGYYNENGMIVLPKEWDDETV